MLSKCFKHLTIKVSCFLLSFMIIGILFCLSGCVQKKAKEESTTKEEIVTVPEKIYYPFDESALLNILESANADNLSTFGESFINIEALENIQSEIDALENQNFSLGFITLDINRHFGLSYNTNWQTTSQSTIKAPYACSLLDAHPELYEEYKDVINPMIKFSDNESYEQILRPIFGIDYMLAWCQRCNVTENIAWADYPRDITVRDMAKFWVLIYELLNSDRVTNEFKDLFNDSAFSSIYLKLSDKYNIQSKAGWEYNNSLEYVDKNPINDEAATNDAGIIYAEAGPYILVIYTDVIADSQTLSPIIGAIDEVMSSAPIYKQ